MHQAFADLFQHLKAATAKIKTPAQFKEAYAAGSLACLNIWNAVHGTDLQSQHDRLHHATQTALNEAFPPTVRQKGVDDVHAIIEENLQRAKLAKAKKK